MERGRAGGCLMDEHSNEVIRMNRLKQWVRAALARAGRNRAGRRSSEETVTPMTIMCGEGCYSIGEDTLVPLGDLGVSPVEYDLQP